MNWKAFIISAIVSIILIACLSGCSGTGFNKEATLMPDRIGVGFSQARYREEDAAYRGFTVNLQWDLK